MRQDIKCVYEPRVCGCVWGEREREREREREKVTDRETEERMKVLER